MHACLPCVKVKELERTHVSVQVEIEGVRLGAPCTPAARAARALPSQAAVPQRSARVRRGAHRPCTFPNQSGPAPPYRAAASSRSNLTAGQAPTAWATVLLKPPKRPCQGRALFQALHSQPHSAQACLSRHPVAARASPPPSRGPAKQCQHCGCMAGQPGGGAQPGRLHACALHPQPQRHPLTGRSTERVPPAGCSRPSRTGAAAPPAAAQPALLPTLRHDRTGLPRPQTLGN